MKLKLLAGAVICSLIILRVAFAQDNTPIAGGGSGSGSVTNATTTVAGITITGAGTGSLLFGTNANPFAYRTDKLSAFAVTTSAELIGAINDPTGSGNLVFAYAPTLALPNIGTATASSVAATGQLRSTVTFASSALTNTINFADTSSMTQIFTNVTTSTTLQTSNLSAGAQVQVILVGAAGLTNGVVFPAGWHVLNNTVTNTYAGKWTVIGLTSEATTDANVLVGSNVER